MDLADIFMLIKVIFILGFVSYLYWVSNKRKK